MIEYFLVMEDEPVIADIYDQLLKEDFPGANVKIAGNGEEGKKAITDILNGGNNKLEAIILDAQMPSSVSGMDLLKYVKNELKLATPVIMIIANPNEYAKQAFQLGAYAVLQKPVYLSMISNTIKKAINERKAA